MIEWLFFDVGSVLVDETATLAARINETAAQSGAPDKETIFAEMKRGAALNTDAYLYIREKYALEKAKWRWELDRLYPDAPEAVLNLKKRFKLGIVANQPRECMEKLYSFGLPRVFDVIAISEELGLYKPDTRLFLAALDMAGCKPENAAMIGDRIDNDIIPAKALGMKAVWMKQGIYAYAAPSLLSAPPDAEASSMAEVESALRSISRL